MKTLPIILSTSLLFSSLFCAEQKSLEQETKAYDQLFEKINEKRFGLDEKVINKTQNPFIFTYEAKKAEDANATKKAAPVYELHAIFGDKVKINGNWYKKRDKIGAYYLVQIKENSAVLANTYKRFELKISRKGNKNVVISVK